MMVDLRYESDSTCVARLEGDLDVTVASAVREALSEAIERGCRNVVLDLSAVAYVDSSCIALLVWLNRALEPRDGRLVLAGASPDVGRILELSGLLRVAPVVSTASDEHEALSSLEIAPTTQEPSWEQDLSFPADTAQLAAARQRVIELIAGLGIPESTMFDIRVAVGEALANAMRHGSPGGRSDTVGVVVEVYDDRVAIVVSDQGCGFDGTLPDTSDLYAASGRGVMFMRALMDRVEFTSCEGGGTSVRLEKHVDRRASIVHRS
jgi:anti-anti-sigma factor